jgi:4,5-dihydroxyphthalate decarboxylase
LIIGRSLAIGEPLRLRIALSPLAHHQALRDGTVAVPGVSFDWVDAPRLPDIFARMGRGLEFDVCELSVMTYLLARQHELPISAIPVVPRHAFHHGDFQVHTDAGISEPSDLEGKRVGTRSWTLTPGVLDRGILAGEYGVNLASITWVLAGEEHLREAEVRLPDNTVQSPGIDLFDALTSGVIDAGIAGVNVGRRRSAGVTALFPDALELDRREYERTGIVPAFTTIVIHDRVLESRPWLAQALYEGFRDARRYGLEPDPTVLEIVDSDPVPLGLSANRRSFEELIRLGEEQGILTVPLDVDTLFASVE